MSSTPDIKQAYQMRMTQKEKTFIRMRLRLMGFSTLRDYYSSPFWARSRKRLRKGACQQCSYRRKLQVHHLTYERLGVEKLEDVVTLCDRCHKAAHDVATMRPKRRPKSVSKRIEAGRTRKKKS